MDYLGGTYISQIRAKNNATAMKLWIANLKTEEIKNFTKNDKINLINTNFIDESPILLNGLKNCWCFCVSTKKGTGFVNFVLTEKVEKKI
jgi:hypothetical protein